MDSTALSLCMENSLPIVVFDIRRPSSIEEVAAGKHAGTHVGSIETEFEKAAAGKTAS